MVITAVVFTIPATLWADDGIDVDDPEQECSTYLDPEIRDDVEAMIFQGVTCFQAEEYDWALTYYTAAYDLDPDPFLLGGIGRSLHELGIYEPAMGYYHRFLHGDAVPSGADRIRRRVDELEEKLGDQGASISLRTSPPGVNAYVVLDNGHWYKLGPTPVDVELRSGDYQFAFHSPGFRPRQVSQSVNDGTSQTLEAELVSEDASLNVSDRKRRASGAWTMAGSIPVTATGATLLALSLQDDNRASLQTPGTIVSAAGLTALITGAVLYFSASSSDPASLKEPESLQFPESAGVEPTVGINHLGLRLRF